ncbi:MAG: 30S ribosomal protein S4 [Candidatus Xiphinematobacter sp.]|nr:MAG: 30S ribosomal protein S4 [Candidatus Xiphinematobacter sp.]QQY11610.1 MAG: 30S ribosomal protein S4 [Candidatus Xiphinematobacter sp.]
MARRTGPKTKVSRRYGVLIEGSARAFENKTYPPGVHGPSRSIRRKLSDYALALAEKQKLRCQYGVLERQFRRYFRQALTKKGVTGEILLQLLETRLDNIVYRMGFSRTLRGARQLVAHGHVFLNSRKIDIASANLRPGDQIGIKGAPSSRSMVQKVLELAHSATVPGWLLVDLGNLTGRMVRLPSKEDINPIVNEQLVVELYSR